MKKAQSKPTKQRSTAARESFDPFEIIGKIPPDKSYQWVGESVFGDPWILSRQARIMRDAGWTPVPAHRHPKMPRRARCIEWGGQVLMERSRERNDAAAASERAKAQEQMRTAATATKHGLAPHVARRTQSVSPPEFYLPDAAAIDSAKEKLKAAGAARYVEVPLNVLISDEEIETAVCVLHLEPAEYMRRRILMDTATLERAPESWRLRYPNAIFQRGQGKDES